MGRGSGEGLGSTGEIVLRAAGASVDASTAKSESEMGGAGAEGEMVALSAIGIGARALRMGAVEPDSRVAVEPSPRRLSPLPLPPRAPSLPPDAAFACCAAFLFFLSIDIGCPGRMCASAHLCPNLQFPFTNHAHTSLLCPGSNAECENGHDAPAVHAPTR